MSPTRRSSSMAVCTCAGKRYRVRVVGGGQLEDTEHPLRVTCSKGSCAFHVATHRTAPTEISRVHVCLMRGGIARVSDNSSEKRVP